MRHPIRGKNILFYCVFWLLVALSILGFGYFYYGLPFKTLAFDVLIFINIIAASLLFMWYPLKYFNVRFMSISTILINHVVIMVLLIALWMGMSYFVVSMLFSPDAKYFNAMAPLKYMLALFSYLLFVLLVQIFESYQKNKEQTENELKLAANLKEAELSVLRNQMNPHFLFNSLNSINALILLNQEKASEMVIKLSDFMRYNVTNSQSKKVKLSHEIAMCQAFLDIEKIRFGDKINIKINIKEKLMNHLVPSLLLQPLFENALKHGLYESVKEETIRLECYGEASKLTFEMSNTFDNHVSKKIGTKSGLKNISQRLNIMYGPSAQLSTKTEDGVFTVKVQIPT